MQLQILTSSISNLCPIYNFKFYLELARCSKCQLFILSKATNKLYGSYSTFCCIHEIDIPFMVETDLVFKLDEVDKEILSNNEDFFIPEDFNYVLLPTKYWDNYIKGELKSVYDKIDGIHKIVDKSNKSIEQIRIFNTDFTQNYEYQIFFNQLNLYLNNLYLYEKPIYITNLESNSSIRNIFDNKVSRGVEYCTLNCGDRKVTFSVFKNLFYLSKSDKLDIEIRFKKYSCNKFFILTFIIKKKKNLFNYNNISNNYPDKEYFFKEKVHVMYLNI